MYITHTHTDEAGQDKLLVLEGKGAHTPMMFPQAKYGTF